MNILVLCINIEQKLPILQMTNLTDCYSDETLLEYDSNVGRIIIQLVPTNKEVCKSFASQISANLSMASSSVRQLYQVLDDFNYENTTSISFMLNDTERRTFKDDFFGYLVLYSYSEFTEVEIYMFDEIKSALDRCILDNSYFVIKSTYDESAGRQVNTFAMYNEPTQMCNNQFQTLAESPTSFLKSMKVIINEKEFSMLQDRYCGFYQLGVPFTYEGVYLQDIDEVLEQLRQEPFHEGRIVLESQQGGSVIEFEILLSQIEVANRPMISVDTFNISGQRKFFPKNQIGMADGTFFAVVEMDLYKADGELEQECVNEFLANISATKQFDSYAYRLHVQIDGQVYTMQKLFQAPFRPSIAMLDFACKEQQDQQQCLKMYTKVQNNPDIAVLHSTLHFFRQSETLLVIHQRMTLDSTCIQKSRVAWIGGNVFEFQFTTSANAQCIRIAENKSQNASLRFCLYDQNSHSASSTSCFTTFYMYNRFDTKLTMNCDSLQDVNQARCLDFIKAAKVLGSSSEQIFAVQIILENGELKHVTTQSRSGYYVYVTAVGAALTAVLIFVVLILSIFHVVAVYKVIKKQKKDSKKR